MADPAVEVVCAGCNKPIAKTDTILTAMSKKYHKACWKCVHCNKELVGSFYKHPDGAWCNECHGATAPKKPTDPCPVCSQPITESSWATFSGKGYHNACFVCATCKKPLPGIKFWTVDNAWYCADDYNAKFSKECHVCHEKLKVELSEEGVEALGVTFHPKCFACVTCHTVLNPDESFYPLNGMPVCPKCRP
ncbi:ZYX protein [Pelomyxa schiedti]|nr:ZYX protein [Pelomyxa schiedti]